MTLAAGGAVLDTLPSKRGKKSKQDLGLVVKPQALRVPPLLCYALEPGHEGRKVTKGENNNEDEIGIRINPGFAAGLGTAAAQQPPMENKGLKVEPLSGYALGKQGRTTLRSASFASGRSRLNRAELRVFIATKSVLRLRI
jgi:hypothetical protein